MSRCRRIGPSIVRCADGDLEPREALQLARHLATCTACRIVLARESRLAGMLGGLDDAVDVDESFFATVMAALPERPPRPAVAIPRGAGWRRGLRLAGFAAISVLCAGLLARTVPSLRLDMTAPAMPRFTPDDTDGWVTLVGAAAQWIRMTAQSLSLEGSPATWGTSTVGALSLLAALAGAAALLAISGALAWATRTGSRAS